MKKVTSILLIVIMVLSMASVSFATTVTNGTTGHSYKAYQVFTGTQAEGTSELAGIGWGTGVDGDDLLEKLKADYDHFDSCSNAADVAKVLAGKQDKCPEAKALANAAAACLKGNGVDIAANADSVSLDPGYYLLVDVTDADGKEDAYNSALLQVTGDDIEIEKKYDVPEVTKKIVENDKEVTTNEAFIGEIVKYRITGTLPTNIEDYEQYFYRFTDTLSKGLTYNDDVKVTVNNKGVEKDVTEYFYIGASAYSETDGTTITVAIKDLLALELLEEPVAITADTTIVIEYSAVLNENAVIGGEGNPNSVDLEFSNNPNDNGDGEPTPPTPPEEEPEYDKPTGVTPEQTVKTYTTEITINKVDNKDKVLTGAGFTLTGKGISIDFVYVESFVEAEDGTFYKLTDGTYTEEEPSELTQGDYASTTTKYKKVMNVVAKTEGFEYEKVGTVDANGQLTFSGLGAGVYTIKETTVPDGYNKAADVSFKITFDPDKETFAVDNDGVKVEVANNTFSVKIVNEKGLVLPETGGMGTTIFYIVGAILLIGSAVVFITKRRMSR